MSTVAKPKLSDFFPELKTNNLGKSAVEECDFPAEINPKAGILPSDFFFAFDDFAFYTEATSPFAFEEGTDTATCDAAVPAQASEQVNGVLVLTHGDVDGSLAADGAQLTGKVPMKPSAGGLVIEVRLHLNTAITTKSINVGFTDVQTLEEPFSIATATVTSTATDAVCFVYDDGATAKTWHCFGVDTDVNCPANAAITSAPVADTFQTLRIEINAAGTVAKFFIDNVLVHTLTGAVVTAATSLYPTIVLNGTDGTAGSADIDYIFAGVNSGR